MWDLVGNPEDLFSQRGSYAFKNLISLGDHSFAGLSISSKSLNASSSDMADLSLLGLPLCEGNMAICSPELRV